MKILLAVDGSTHSMTAVQRVAERPWPEASEVKIIYVVEPPPIPSYDESLAAHIEEAGRILEGAAAEIRSRGNNGLRICTEMIEGSPKEQILNEAEGWGADLIVVGSHGYNGLQRFLLGSVSQAVALHAKCSVEIART